MARTSSRGYTKKRNFRKKRTYRKKPVSRKEIYRIAKKASLGMSKTKRHVFTGQESLQQWGMPYGTGAPAQTWFIQFPLAISAATPSSDIQSLREGPCIYWNNTRYVLNLQGGKAAFQPFKMRVLAGYFKGANAVAPNGLTTSILTQLFPNTESQIDTNYDERKNFKIICNKVTTHMPAQLYDGLDELEDESQVTNALWRPYRYTFNFIDKRKHNFLNTDGDSIIGWSPFFAIQMMPVHGENAWDLNATGTAVKSAGSAPNVNLHTTTYFKDITS